MKKLLALIALFVLVGCRSQAKPQGLLTYAAAATTTANYVGTGVNGQCPLGFVQSDPNVSTCSAAFGWTPVYSDAGTIVGPTIPLAPGDDAFVTLAAQMEIPNATDNTGHCWTQTKWGVAYLADGGAMLSPTGVDAGVQQDGQCGTGMTGIGANLVQSGNSVAVTTAGWTPYAIKGNLDYTRGALAPFVLSVSPTSIVADAGGAVTITTTPGAAQYATTATLGAAVGANGAVTGGFTVGCSQTGNSTAVCQVPPSAGYLSDGGLASGGVALTSQANPFPLQSGFSFTSGTTTPPTFASIDRNDGSAAGGDVRHITLGGASCTAVTVSGVTISTASSAATSVSYNSGTCVVTLSTPAATAGTGGTTSAGTITVATSAGNVTSSGAHQNFYYNPSASLVDYWVADIGATSTTWNTQTASGDNFSGTATVGSNFAGNGRPDLNFNGSSNTMSSSLASTLSAGAFTICAVMQTLDASPSGEQILVNFHGGGNGTYIAAVTGPLTSFLSGAGPGGSPATYDTNGHIWCFQGGGSANATINWQFDSTTGSYSTTAQGNLTGVILGATTAPSLYAHANIQSIWSYSSGTMSMTTIAANLLADM